MTSATATDDLRKDSLPRWALAALTVVVLVLVGVGAWLVASAVSQPGRAERYLIGITVLVLVVAGVGVVAITHAARPRARHTLTVGLAAAVVVGAVGAGAAAWALPARALPETPELLRPPQVWPEGELGDVLALPSGGFLVELDGMPHLARTHDDRPRSLTIGVWQHLTSATPSADGATVLGVDAGSGVVAAFDAATGEELWWHDLVTDDTAGWVQILAVPSDGGVVLLHGQGTDTQLIALDGDGAERWTTPAPDGETLKSRSPDSGVHQAPQVIVASTDLRTPPNEPGTDTLLADPTDGTLIDRSGWLSTAVGAHLVNVDEECTATIHDARGDELRTVDLDCTFDDGGVVTTPDNLVLIVAQRELLQLDPDADADDAVTRQPGGAPRPGGRDLIVEGYWESGTEITVRATGVELPQRPGWGIEDYRLGTLAMTAEELSRNPRRGADHLATHVELRDIGSDGEICATVQLPSPRHEVQVRALPDCRAIVADPAWPSPLVVSGEDTAPDDG